MSTGTRCWEGTGRGWGPSSLRDLGTTGTRDPSPSPTSSSLSSYPLRTFSPKEEPTHRLRRINYKFSSQWCFDESSYDGVRDGWISFSVSLTSYLLVYSLTRVRRGREEKGSAECRPDTPLGRWRWRFYVGLRLEGEAETRVAPHPVGGVVRTRQRRRRNDRNDEDEDGVSSVSLGGGFGFQSRAGREETRCVRYWTSLLCQVVTGSPDVPHGPWRDGVPGERTTCQAKVVWVEEWSGPCTVTVGTGTQRRVRQGLREEGRTGGEVKETQRTGSEVLRKGLTGHYFLFEINLI